MTFFVEIMTGQGHFLAEITTGQRLFFEVKVAGREMRYLFANCYFDLHRQLALNLSNRMC